MVTQTPDNMLDHALAYIRAGIPVLPLKPRSKEPSSAHGKDDATLDPEEVTQWWQRRPHDNIGVRPPVGFVVVDEDVQNGGDKTLAELCHQHGGDLSGTWTARTGNGGRHIWLRADPPFRGKLCDGVDLKHHSGYLVAPPSVHPNGRRYQWLNDLPIAYAPDWLRPLLAPQPSPVRSPVLWESYGGSSGDGDALVRFVAGTPEGNRNKALFWAVRTAAEEGVIDRIRDDLLAAAVGIGLTDEAVKATIKSGIKAARPS